MSNKKDNLLQRLFASLSAWWRKGKHQCEQCGSWDTEHSHRWARGYNHLCKQAYGDLGAYCNKCCHVTWDTPLDEHIKQLPNWCTPTERK